MRKMGKKEPEEYYGTLGAGPCASASEIKQAFRRQVKYLHPDRNESEGAREAFQRLLKAYEVLGDPVRRAEYDGKIFLRGLRNGEALDRSKNLWGDSGHGHWGSSLLGRRWRSLWRYTAFQGIFVVGVALLVGGLIGRGKSAFNNAVDRNSHWSSKQDWAIQPSTIRSENSGLDVAQKRESLEVADRVQPAEPPETKDRPPEDLWYVTAKSLRVRAGPGTSYRVQGIVKQFDTLEVRDEADTGDWVAVRIGTDLKGFVLRNYIAKGDGRLVLQPRGEDRGSRPEVGTNRGENRSKMHQK
jgi:curved DNA-binding protein CbpA